MKKITPLLLIATLIPMGSATAGTYFEFDSMLLSIEESTPAFPETYTAEPTVMGLKVGVEFSPALGFEGLVGLGISDDEFGNSGLDVGLNNLFGFYLVGKLPLGHAGSLYGKAGFATLQFEDTDGDTLDGNGASFGFGASLHLGRNLAIVGEYMAFPDVAYDDSVYGFPVNGESDSVNIGIQLRF